MDLQTPKNKNPNDPESTINKLIVSLCNLIVVLPFITLAVCLFLAAVAFCVQYE